MWVLWTLKFVQAPIANIIDRRSRAKADMRRLEANRDESCEDFMAHLRRTVDDMALSMGSFCGCPQNRSPTILASILGPLILGNSHMDPA